MSLCVGESDINVIKRFAIRWSRGSKGRKVLRGGPLEQGYDSLEEVILDSLNTQIDWQSRPAS